MTPDLQEQIVQELGRETGPSPAAHTQYAVDDAVAALAKSLDCLTEVDLCVLCGITRSTAEAWRKRSTGPAYALVGNRVLYPRVKVLEFIQRQVRERNEGVTAKGLL